MRTATLWFCLIRLKASVWVSVSRATRFTRSNNVRLKAFLCHCDDVAILFSNFYLSLCKSCPKPTGHSLQATKTSVCTFVMVYVLATQPWLCNNCKIYKFLYDFLEFNVAATDRVASRITRVMLVSPWNAGRFTFLMLPQRGKQMVYQKMSIMIASFVEMVRVRRPQFLLHKSPLKISQANYNLYNTHRCIHTI